MDIAKIRGGGGLLLRRYNLLNSKEMKEVKEWKLILNYDFDESGSAPDPIDVSNYTEFMLVGIGLINKHESTASNCNVFFNNNYHVALETQANKNPSQTRTQYFFAEYNGLVFRQVKLPWCSNNGGMYDSVYTNSMAPHSYSVMNEPLSKLSIKYTTSAYTCISGNLKIYAR